MATRLYIVPVVGTGTKSNPRTPKYFTDGTITSTSWTANVYGFEPWAIVAADLSPADDTIIVNEPDAFALPFDLSPLLTAPQVTNVQAKLEAANIPSGWVNTSLTWTLVVRTVLGMFEFFQRYSGIYAKQTGLVPTSLFTGGVTLDSTFGSLPSANQNALTGSAQSFGISTAGLTASTTMRTILKAMADNFQNQVYNFGSYTI